MASLAKCPNYHTYSTECLKCSDGGEENNAAREREFTAICNEANEKLFHGKGVKFIVGPLGSFIVLELTFKFNQMMSNVPGNNALQSQQFNQTVNPMMPSKF